MRFSTRRLALGSGAALVLVAGSLLAEENVVVARVGEETIARRAVEERVRAMPVYQLSRMGDDAVAIARAVVDDLVRSSLLAQGARADGLGERPEERDRIRSILASALLYDIREKAAEEAVTDAEVEAFYRANQARYASQDRLRIFQITVDSRKKAEELLDTIASDADYRKDPVAGWDKLAREHSIDETTNMRAGDLGFVHPDGTTRHKDVTVPVAIYEAAAKVKDGEVVPEPVKIGDQWLVIQRRGSVQTPQRSLEEETPTIRALLAKQKAETMRDELLERLRKEHVSEIHPELVERIDVDADGDIAPVKRPNSLREAQKAPASPRPEGEPGNYR